MKEAEIIDVMPMIRQRKINDAVDRFEKKLPKLFEDRKREGLECPIIDDYTEEKQNRDTIAVKNFVNSPLFSYIKEMK